MRRGNTTLLGSGRGCWSARASYLDLVDGAGGCSRAARACVCHYDPLVAAVAHGADVKVEACQAHKRSCSICTSRLGVDGDVDGLWQELTLGLVQCVLYGDSTI